MAYTFSFDASLKLTPKHSISGFLNHFAREENEIEINHSNENIDPSRTHENRTYIYDPEKGRMVLSTSHEQIIDALRDSLDRAVDMENRTYRNTGRAIRKDAVLAYGLIMQIDPQFYKDHKDDEQLMAQSYVDMIRIAQERFGKENIVAASLHLDEANPHLHFIMTPVTSDGRLNQKQFINAPKLTQMHNEFRNKLRGKGYDIDLERKTPVGAKRLSEKDYKELQKAQEQLEAIEAEKSTLDAQKREFEAYRASQLQNMQTQREAQLLQQAEADKATEFAQSQLRELDERLKLGDNTRASRMAKFMQGCSMGGKTAYEVFCEREPGMIAQEQKAKDMAADAIRRAERILSKQPSRGHGIGF